MDLHNIVNTFQHKKTSKYHSTFQITLTKYTQFQKKFIYKVLSRKNIAIPIPALTPEIIQNRITILGSLQPLASK